MSEQAYQCGRLTKADVGKTVELKGWVQRRRDLGGVLFIDLRDRTGIVQIVFNPACRATRSASPTARAASTCSL